MTTGLAVVADHHLALRGETTLAVIAWDGVLEELLELKGVHIDLVEHVLHVVEVDVVFRVGEVAHDRGDPGGHFPGIDGAYLACLVDGVVGDKKLLRFLVNHSRRRSAADTFGMDRHIHVLVDRVELVIRAFGHVRGIGHHPQFVCPWNHCPDAALLVSGLEELAILTALGIGGEVRIDTADFAAAGRGHHLFLALDGAEGYTCCAALRSGVSCGDGAQSAGKHTAPMDSFFRSFVYPDNGSRIVTLDFHINCHTEGLASAYGINAPNN